MMLLLLLSKRKKHTRIKMENTTSEKSPISLTIHYASQTGQAEAIAKEIHTSCPEQSVLADIYCLSLTEKKFCINKERLAIFVVSTTGDGESPDTARKFVRRLNKKTLPKDYLKDLWFGFLALGDSNYTNFCNCGKALEKRLLDLGARPFYPTGYADDAVGLELVVEPWIEGLWPVLRNHYNNIIAKNDISSSLYEGLKMQSELQNSLSSLKIDNEIDGTFKNGQYLDLSNKEEAYSDNEIIKIQQVECSSNDNFNQSQKTVNKWTTPFQNLIEKTLKLPKCNSACKFSIEYHPEMQLQDNPKSAINQAYSSAISEVKMVPIIAAKKLTRKDAIKTTLELQLDITNLELDYEPGDTFGIVCPNDDETVDYLLQRLGVKDSEDVLFNLKPSDSSFNLPAHIPEMSTLKNVFKALIDVRAVPKKALLRMMADYTDDSNQKRRLQELSSIQGAKEYTKWIREPHTNIIDILRAFPSCQPPIERLLESLPRLQPRAYSVASSPLHCKNKVKFVFNIAVIPGFDDVTPTRIGLCTGWLNELVAWKSDASLEQENTASFADILVPVFWRRRTSFQLPVDSSLPIVMIGPGTGIAPFIGFLQHRELQKKANPDGNWGPMYLFFGCRHKQRDFLYKDDLNDFIDKRILTKLFVSFSRDEDQREDAPRYVQDNLFLNKDLIVSAIIEKGAIVYICGDAANMARNVRQTMLKMFQNTQNISEDMAIIELKKLTEQKRYLEDIWT